ncbi:hypothetical protein JCM14469_09200 [Desulfatiferula olefinivorans]
MNVLVIVTVNVNGMNPSPRKKILHAIALCPDDIGLDILLTRLYSPTSKNSAFTG